MGAANDARRDVSGDLGMLLPATLSADELEHCDRIGRPQASILLRLQLIRQTLDGT